MHRREEERGDPHACPHRATSHHLATWTCVRARERFVRALTRDLYFSLFSFLIPSIPAPYFQHTYNPRTGLSHTEIHPTYVLMHAHMCTCINYARIHIQYTYIYVYTM